MMRYIAALASGILLGEAANADRLPPSGWSRISDAHGSSLEIPTSLLRRKRDPLSLVFVGNDAARITFETITEPRPGFPGNDPEGDMSLRRSDCTAWPPSYRVLKNSLAAYSCVRGALCRPLQPIGQHRAPRAISQGAQRRLGQGRRSDLGLDEAGRPSGTWARVGVP